MLDEAFAELGLAPAQLRVALESQDPRMIEEARALLLSTIDRLSGER